MKKKIIGILICMLLIVNTSTVLSISEEKTNKNKQESYYIFEGSSVKREIKYPDISNHLENDLPIKIINSTYDNLAPNPSFEEGDTLPTGWIYDPNTNGIFHWNSNYSHSGEKSIGSLNLTYKQNVIQILIWETTDFIPINFVENEYKLEGWVKFLKAAEPNQRAGFGVQYYNELYHSIGGMNLVSYYSSEWNFLDCNTTIFTQYKNDAKYVKLRAIQYSVPNTEPNPLVEVRFDDIYFGVLTKRPVKPICSYDKENQTLIVRSTDSDGDQIRYGVSWNNDQRIDKWTTYYDSGEEAKIDCKGRKSKVGIIAEDSKGAQSDWISVKSKGKSIEYFLIYQLFNKFFYNFSIINKILKQIM